MHKQHGSVLNLDKNAYLKMLWDSNLDRVYINAATILQIFVSYVKWQVALCLTGKFNYYGSFLFSISVE